jgi:hypothetical protein
MKIFYHKIFTNMKKNHLLDILPQPEGQGFPNQALLLLRAVADSLRGCGRNVCPVYGLTGDTF